MLHLLRTVLVLDLAQQPVTLQGCNLSACRPACLAPAGTAAASDNPLSTATLQWRRIVALPPGHRRRGRRGAGGGVWPGCFIWRFPAACWSPLEWKLRRLEARGEARPQALELEAAGWVPIGTSAQRPSGSRATARLPASLRRSRPAGCGDATADAGVLRHSRQRASRGGGAAWRGGIASPASRTHFLGDTRHVCVDFKVGAGNFYKNYFWGRNRGGQTKPHALMRSASTRGRTWTCVKCRSRTETH